MSTFNMRNLSIVLVFSATCLCLTMPSHALSVRQKLVNLGTSIDQIKDTMNATSRDLHQKLIEMTEVMNAKVLQITEKMDRITGTLDDVITATGCQANFTLFESSCYYFGDPLPSHAGDQSYAQSQCSIMGSNLVVIESKKEADFILNRTVPGNLYWTSAHKHGSIWMWDSTAVSIPDVYSPWQTGEPNTAAYLCAYVHGSNGKQYDASCSTFGYRYICETKLPTCA